MDSPFNAAEAFSQFPWKMECLKPTMARRTQRGAASEYVLLGCRCADAWELPTYVRTCSRKGGSPTYAQYDLSTNLCLIISSSMMYLSLHYSDFTFFYFTFPYTMFVQGVPS